MKTYLLVTSMVMLLSGCISPYDYEDCGVLYDKPTANPLGTSGDIFPDTWGDLVMASRSANQEDFFKNNACRLGGIKTQGPKQKRDTFVLNYNLFGEFLS